MPVKKKGRVKKAAEPTIGGLTMEQVYNRLMLDIEPELITNVLPYLDVMYANEPPHLTRERAKRYVKAIETFQKRFEKFAMDLRELLERLKEEALEKLAEKEERERTQTLDALEHEFGAA